MSDEYRRRRERAAQNEQALQEHNQRLAELGEQGGVSQDEAMPFACECDDPACGETVMLPLGEYERVTALEDRFVVVAGHEDPAVERVIDAHGDYLIVSKPDVSRRRRL
jgi:hypothetical protein